MNFRQNNICEENRESISVMTKLIFELGKTPSGTCTVKEGAELLGITEAELKEILETVSYWRLLYNPGAGRIWRN